MQDGYRLRGGGEGGIAGCRESPSAGLHELDLVRVQAADGCLNQLVALRADWAKFIHRLGASDPDDLLAYAPTLDHADIVVERI